MKLMITGCHGNGNNECRTNSASLSLTIPPSFSGPFSNLWAYPVSLALATSRSGKNPSSQKSLSGQSFSATRGKWIFLKLMICKWHPHDFYLASWPWKAWACSSRPGLPRTSCAASSSCRSCRPGRALRQYPSCPSLQRNIWFANVFYVCYIISQIIAPWLVILPISKKTDDFRMPFQLPDSTRANILTSSHS